MIYKKKEGGFYASKVRLFLNEYDGIPLEEFCKAEKVSYSKMLNCLGRTNSQYHPVSKPKSDKTVKAPTPEKPQLPALELKELVVDMPEGQETSEETLSRVTLINDPKPHFILEAFSEMIDEVDFATESEKQDYKNRVEKAINDSFIPAFKGVKDVMEEYKGTGLEEGYNELPGYTDYYDYILR